jgi:hypothetical protein
MFLEKTSTSKKLKPFFDLALKPRHRFVALKAYLSSDEIEHKEIVDFFRNNQKLLIDLVIDGFSKQCERIKAEIEYAGKFYGSEGFAKNMFVVELLGWLIKLTPTELVKSEHLSDVVNVIRVLLIPGNDQVVQTSGMHLLLAWILHKDCPPVLLTLFSSAINVKKYCDYIRQESFPVNSNEIPILASSEDLNAPLLLLDDTLREIDTYDGADFKKLFELFKEAYLDKLYLQDQAVSFRVQQIIIENLAKWFCSRKALIVTEGNLVVIKRVIDSGLKLPYEFYPSLKNCLSVLKNWLFIEPIPEALSECIEYAGMVMNLFDKRPYIGFQNEQVDSYQEGIYFFRSFLCSESTDQDKKLIAMNKLLEMGEFLFTNGDLIVSKGLENDLGRLYGETLWFCLIKSQIKSRQIFEQVSSSVQLMNNLQIIHEWSKSLNSVIDHWALQKYKIKFEIGEKGLSVHQNCQVTENEQSFQGVDLLFYWKNFSRAVGNIFSLSKSVYEEAALTFARIADKLLRISSNLAHEFIFILMQVAVDNESVKARKAAFSIVCRYFCDNIDYSDKEDAMFFTVLERALEDSMQVENNESGLTLVLLENTSDLFKPTRRNVSLLIPSYLNALIWQIEKGSKIIISKLWDVCRILGDIYLLSGKEMYSKSPRNILNVLDELYHKICKNETELLGPFLCTISNLIIQTSGEAEEKEFLLGYLLENIVPKDGGIINFLAIEAVEAISVVIDSYPGGKGVLVQRIILAIRSCLLPVPGGDNRKQDAIGGRLIATLGHFIKSGDELNLRKGVWELMDDCENISVSGGGISHIKSAAKYLKSCLLNYNNNHSVEKHRANSVGIAYHQKIRSILSFSDDTNSAVCRTMAGSFNYEIWNEESKTETMKNIGVVFGSAVSIPEVEPYLQDHIGGDDSENLVQEAIDWVSTEYPTSCHAGLSEFVPAEFEKQVNDYLLMHKVREIAEQVNQFYNEEQLVAEHYRQLISTKSDTKYQSHAKIQNQTSLNILLNDLGLVSMNGFDKAVVRPITEDSIKGIDGVAPKEIVVVYYQLGVEEVLPAIAQQQSEGVYVAESGWFEIIYQKIDLKSSNNAKSIVLSTPHDQILGDNLHLVLDSANSTLVFQNGQQVVAPLGFGSVVRDLNSLYSLITPTVIQLTRQLTGQSRHLPHPYDNINNQFSFRYSGREAAMNNKLLLGHKFSLEELFSLGESLEEEEASLGILKAAAIDGINNNGIGTSYTGLKSPVEPDSLSHLPRRYSQDEAHLVPDNQEQGQHDTRFRIKVNPIE